MFKIIKSFFSDNAQTATVGDHISLNEDFKKNLALTQIYCDRILKNSTQNVVAMFRTINPLYKGEPLFTFLKGNFTFENQEFQYDYCKWLVDPFEDKYLMSNLFDEQILLKKKSIANAALEIDTKGKIVIADFDDTVVDGASEVESQGLFDLYDLPPIDTWFYMQTDLKGWRRIFAWIPEPLMALTDKAIAVNCVDCIYWL